LEPDAAYAAVRKQGRDSGDSLSITERTLRTRLHERRLLLSVEDSRPTLVVRRTLGGRHRGVLHLSSNFLSPYTDQPDHEHQESLGYGESAPRLWSGSEWKPDHESDQGSPSEQNGQDRNAFDHETEQQNPFTYGENYGIGQVFDNGRDHKSDEDEMCKHGYLGGTGCYLCDPNHPHRLEEGVKA
jgi:hypothetical protein